MKFANPVPGPHIGPLGHLEGQRGPSIPPPPDHRLPSGRWCFRVTQTFDSPDFYWVNHGRPDAKHQAMDLGNHACGEAVLAMAAGKAYAAIDSAGALYVLVDHGNGWVTRYWHLAAWTAPVRKGVWVPIAARQQIGVVGDTGLGAICHLHVEAVYQGVKRDPWPLLAQNQEDGPVYFGASDFEHFSARATCLQGARLRSEPSTKSGEILRTFEAGARVVVYARAKGRRTELVSATDPWWYLVSAWVPERGFVDGAWMAGITFSSVEAVVASDLALQTKIDRAITALEGVAPPIQASLRSVETALAELRK